MKAEGNSQAFETTLQGSQKKNGEMVSEIRYKKEEGGLVCKAHLVFGACLIVCFSSIIQHPTLGACKNQTHDGRWVPRRLQSTCALQSQEWHV